MCLFYVKYGCLDHSLLVPITSCPESPPETEKNIMKAFLSKNEDRDYRGSPR